MTRGDGGRDRIVVAGAGPAGVGAALAAANEGFPVTLVEASEQVDDSPRAATLHPSTLEMLSHLGILDEVVAAGLVARYFDFWDRPSLTRVARMDHELLQDETPFPFVVQTEQHKLVRIALDRLATLPDVDIRLGWSVTDVTQDGDEVEATIGNGEEAEKIRGSWLVGSDGGRSTVRKALGVEFEGYTWPERFVVLTTPRDVQADIDCCYRNYFADPDEWTNLFKVSGDDMSGRWRVVFPTRPDEPDSEAISDDASQARLRRVLAVDEPVELVHRNIYHVHQRVAATFRVGRVFLAGDAAHVNNPIGGLGLNCGLHDAMELVDTLAAAGGHGRLDENLLDRYERRRRTLNIEFVQQQTIDNKRRLEERDPERRQARFDELAAIAADEHRHRAFLRRTSLLDSVRRARRIA